MASSPIAHDSSGSRDSRQDVQHPQDKVSQTIYCNLDWNVLGWRVAAVIHTVHTDCDRGFVIPLRSSRVSVSRSDISSPPNTPFLLLSLPNSARKKRSYLSFLHFQTSVYTRSFNLSIALLDMSDSIPYHATFLVREGESGDVCLSTSLPGLNPRTLDELSRIFRRAHEPRRASVSFLRKPTLKPTAHVCNSGLGFESQWLLGFPCCPFSSDE